MISCRLLWIMALALIQAVQPTIWPCSILCTGHATPSYTMLHHVTSVLVCGAVRPFFWMLHHSLNFTQFQFHLQLITKYNKHRKRLNYLNSPRYKASSGALVFGAGTVQWAWGLDNFHDAVTGMNNMWESEHLATYNDHQWSINDWLTLEFVIVCGFFLEPLPDSIFLGSQVQHTNRCGPFWSWSSGAASNIVTCLSVRSSRFMGFKRNLRPFDMNASSFAKWFQTGLHRGTEDQEEMWRELFFTVLYSTVDLQKSCHWRTVDPSHLASPCCCAKEPFCWHGY